MNDNKNIKTKPIELPLRVGAKYQTRDGRVFEIASVDPSRGIFAVSSVERDACGERRYWCSTGQNFEGRDHSFDLVAEVVAEKTAVDPIHEISGLLCRLSGFCSERNLALRVEATSTGVVFEASAVRHGVTRAGSIWVDRNRPDPTKLEQLISAVLA